MMLSSLATTAFWISFRLCFFIFGGPSGSALCRNVIIAYTCGVSSVAASLTSFSYLLQKLPCLELYKHRYSLLRPESEL
uniref:Uncharacterized protein n=1 Tax=Ixodes ricinus TaxID=34613 RepID=A0A6B0U6X9_IXORI